MARNAIVPALIVAAMIGVATGAAGDPAELNQEQQRPCSDQTLKGHYGYHGGGTIQSMDYLAIGTAEFDGKGNFTWTSSDLPETVMTGTYSVAADCTASAIYNFFEGIPPSHSKFVIVENGREFYVVDEPPAPFVPSTMLFIYRMQSPPIGATCHGGIRGEN